ncbi:MAG: single-stranded-DNA-specific exonuclease RecJ [Candidatus Saccharimonas sp.]
MTLFEQILVSRGLVGEARESFLNPDYNAKHDPFLLSDMQKAVDRLKRARNNQEKVVIYGDYDIDGLSATALLLDAFTSFGFKHIDAFIPNRFNEGYGMTKGAVDKVKALGADLIVTVDCGSLCHEEIAYASTLGVDTVVTDHHNIAPTRPPAIATVNPKYNDHSYPFRDLAGVGVAFKLVQAMQQQMEGLPEGHEKWLLDLVSLGTVCDIVTLRDENRANVYWGIEVMKKQRRPGLKALLSVAGVTSQSINTQTLGFSLGPRMNAAGRLDSALYSLDMLRAKDELMALEAAQKLDEFNVRRKSIQEDIFTEASRQAETMIDKKVLVVSAPGWNHGVIGIVASKLVEAYHKPTFVIAEHGEVATGSARSFGEFSVADAVRAAEETIIKGGGHAAAAGVTLETAKIPDFRKKVNEYYESLRLTNQDTLLLPRADVELQDFSEVDEQLIQDIAQLEPFGNGNSEPVLKISSALVVGQRRMGSEGQHVKLTVQDSRGQSLKLLAFNAPEDYFVEPGEYVDVWICPTMNEWNGFRSVEGRLLYLQRN